MPFALTDALVRRHRSANLRGPHAAWIVLLLGLFLTAVLTLMFLRLAAESNRERFHASVDQMQASIHGRLGTYIAMLNATAGLFEAADEVTPDQFATFVDRLELETRYAGVQGIGFIERVAEHELDGLQQRMQRQGWEDFTIWSPPNLDAVTEHYVVTLLEPLTEQNMHAIGFDKAAEPIRLEAMERARETGLPAATAMVTLVMEITGIEDSGFVLYVPAYRHGEFIGFTFSPFRAEHLMERVLRSNQTTGFHVFDGGEIDPDRLMYRSTIEGPEREPWLTTSRHIAVAGRTWTVVFHTLPQFEATLSGRWIPLIPLLGVLASVLTSAFVWYLGRARSDAAERAEQLYEQRERFAVTLASIGDAVIATDAAGRVTFMNGRAERLVGCDLADCAGRDAEEVLRFVDEQTGEPTNAVQEVLSRRKKVASEGRTILVRIDGDRIPVDLTGAPIRARAAPEGRRGKRGRTIGAVITLRDISERRRTEERLVRSEERFRNLVTMTSAIIWTADAKSQVVEEVPSWEAFTGQTPEQYRNEGWVHAIHPDDRREVLDVWSDAQRTRSPFHLRYRLRHRSGDYRRIEARGVPMLDEHGEIREWVGSITDIEEQQRTAEALFEAEQRFRWIVESAVDFAIFTFDTEGVITSWNSGAQRVLGHSEEDIIGRNVDVIFTPEDRDIRQAEIERTTALEDGDRALDERWHVRASGEQFYAAGRVMPLRDDQGRLLGFLKILIDRTAERRIQEELQRQTQQLRESESRFRTMADSAPVLIWMAGTDKNCVWFNQPWLEFAGRSLDHAVAAPWYDMAHPDDREACIRTYRKSFDVRRTFKMKYRMRRHDGQYRWVLDHGIPLHAGDGAFMGYIGSCIDITELEEARETLQRHSDELGRLVEERTEKLRESHEQLRLSERMASLGTLAAGIGHDLGNLLLPVRMRLDAIEPKLASDDRENVEVIRTAASYLGNLSKGLRYLATDPATSDEEAPTAMDLATWWEEAHPLLKNALPKNVKLEHDVPADLPSVKVAPSALTQAVFNLMQNAGNALRDREQGTVRVWADATADEQVNVDMVRLGVTDDGPGMSAEVKRRCLEPFFSTRTREFSTGLGLSLVQGVVKRAGGRIEIESEPGEGATFILVFPAEAAPAEEPRKPAMRPAAAVMVDEPRMRAFIISELRSLGMQVAQLEPGQEAAVASEALSGADISVWVVKSASLSQEQLTSLKRFAEEDSRRRVVIFMEESAVGNGLHSAQFIRTGATFRPSRVRDVLRKAAMQASRDKNRGHGQGESHPSSMR